MASQRGCKACGLGRGVEGHLDGAQALGFSVRILVAHEHICEDQPQCEGHNHKKCDGLAEYAERQGHDDCFSRLMTTAATLAKRLAPINQFGLERPAFNIKDTEGGFHLHRKRTL